MTRNAKAPPVAQTNAITWMARDEMIAYQLATTEREVGRLHAAAYRRRAKLSRIDQKHVSRLSGDPDAIQAVFDRRGLPLAPEIAAAFP